MYAERLSSHPKIVHVRLRWQREMCLQRARQKCERKRITQEKKRKQDNERSKNWEVAGTGITCTRSRKERGENKYARPTPLGLNSIFRRISEACNWWRVGMFSRCCAWDYAYLVVYKDTPMRILWVVKGGMDQSNRSASALREEIKPVRMEGNGKWGLLQREQGKTRLMAGYWPDGRQSSK